MAEPTKPAEPAPVPARRRKPEPPPAPAFSPEDAARVAAETVKAYRSQEPQAQDLPPEVQKKVDLYQELETLFPERYPKGSAKRIAAAEAAELDYAESWERAHPGEVFDASATEHASWYRKNYPDSIPTVQKDDLEEAKTERRVRARIEAAVAPQLEEVRRTAALAQAEPKARALASDLESVPFSVFNPEHKGEVSKAVKEKWAAEHPVEAKLLAHSTQQAQALAYEASLLWDGAKVFDDRNPAHQASLSYLQRMETELAQHPGPVEDDYRRTWLPSAEYERLPAQKRAGHFTTSKEALAHYIALSEANRAKALLSELGLDKLSVSPVTQTPSAPPAAAPAPAPSPSISAGAPTPARVGAAPSDPGRPPNRLMRAFGIG